MTSRDIRLKIVEHAYRSASPAIDRGYSFVDSSPVQKLCSLEPTDFRGHVDFLVGRGLLELHDDDPSRIRITQVAFDLCVDGELMEHLDERKGLPEGYDVAEICQNGHVITTSAIDYPQFRKPHCPTCGQKTITECPSCGKQIPGHYNISNAIQVSDNFSRPSYCHNCGEAYPWTEAALVAARELAHSVGLDDSDAESLAETIDDLVSEGPRTAVATQKFRSLVQKAGGSAVDLFHKILANVVTEAVKQQIFY